MNIKDYLHYYIDQQCFNAWFTADHPQYDNDRKLVGIDNMSCRPYKLENEDDFTWTDKIIPKLRRLADMRDEEKKKIWEIIFQRPFHQNGSIVWIDKETYTTTKRWVLSSGLERLGIELNGTVWADSDLNHWKFNPHFVNHYLIQRGFWLFGDEAFERGLVIDQKSIQS